MKILYIAKHDSGGNDDEGAIVHALRALNHTVIKASERRGPEALAQYANDVDFCLIHLWPYVGLLDSYPSLFKVFWYFDLVSCADPALSKRCENRRLWFNEAARICNLGFATDGDAAVQFPNVMHLPQGFDSRYGPVKDVRTPREVPILFTGISRGGGARRESWVKMLSDEFGAAFHHIKKGTHQKALADVVRHSTLTVCPDYPVTDRYWSNRIYLMTGYGGAVLHPHCGRLASQFKHESEVLFYKNRDDLLSMIRHLLRNPGQAMLMRQNGCCRTFKDHLYQDRVAELLSCVKEKL